MDGPKDRVNDLMTVRVEPLTWEVLDYWKASGLPYGPTITGTSVVSRSREGNINGFAVIGNHPDAQVKLLIEPLIADNGKIAVRVIDKLEELLISKGIPGYGFYVAKDHPWLRQVRRLEKMGIMHRLGETEDCEWFCRKF